MEPYQFTLHEANALIPWLDEKFRNLNMLHQEYVVTKELIEKVQISSDQALDAINLKATAEQLARQIDEEVEEILDQGIIVRDMSRGLVDFPSVRDAEDIYLCWIGGEKRIDYWHEIDQGFSHRKPI